VAIRLTAPASVRLLLDRVEPHDRPEGGAADTSGEERVMAHLTETIAKRVTLLVAAIMFPLAFAPSVALAQDIPDYDSQAYCERVAANAAKPDAVRGRCLWLEEYALDELETFWPLASGRVREDCAETASAEESYAVLARCVMGRLGRSR
jgi:hypothetical protein